jgi:hypothetical protein
MSHMRRYISMKKKWKRVEKRKERSCSNATTYTVLGMNPNIQDEHSILPHDSAESSNSLIFMNE